MDNWRYVEAHPSYLLSRCYILLLVCSFHTLNYSSDASPWQRRFWESAHGEHYKLKVRLESATFLTTVYVLLILTTFVTVPSLPVRTSSKRRSRTPRILQEEDQSSVSSPRQLRSRGRKNSSIAEENEQENNTAEKSAPAAETRRSKHTVQPTTSPIKVNPHLRTTSKPANGKAPFLPLNQGTVLNSS